MAFYIPTPSHSRAIDFHSFPFPFPILSPIPITMGIPWDSHSHWSSLVSMVSTGRWAARLRSEWARYYSPFRAAGVVCIGYCAAAVDKRVHSTSLYHCRQCSIVLKPRSDRIDYTVVCFTTHDCSRKLWKHSTTSASWALWFKLQVLTQVGATTAGVCVPRSGRDSAAVTTPPTPSPSTSAALNTSWKRRSFICPKYVSLRPLAEHDVCVCLSVCVGLSVYLSVRLRGNSLARLQTHRVFTDSLRQISELTWIAERKQWATSLFDLT